MLSVEYNKLLLMYIISLMLVTWVLKLLRRVFCVGSYINYAFVAKLTR